MNSLKIEHSSQISNNKLVRDLNYQDTSRVSRVAKRVVIALAQFWRLIPYSVHVLANIANKAHPFSTRTNWHMNQQNAWDGLKVAANNTAILKWYSNGNEHTIFKILRKALWFNPN